MDGFETNSRIRAMEDVNQTMEVIRQISKINPELADFMESLVDEFRFDTLKNIGRAINMSTRSFVLK